MFHSVSTFRVIAFPSGSFSDVPDAVISNELAVAESEILAALRPFHSLPINTGSYGQTSELAVLYNAQATMVSFRVMMFTGFKPSLAGSADDVLQARYLEIVGEGGLLDKISRGKYLLPIEADATPTVREKRSRMFGSPSRGTTITDANGKQYI